MKHHPGEIPLKHLPRELDPDLPLSVALGAGGIRGLAHVGALDVLLSNGFKLTEMVGTSVGAIILAFYAAVGMDLPNLENFGINLTSRHLLAWAWLHRAPQSIKQRFLHRAGIIPESLEKLDHARTDKLFHGVERIGVVAYDLIEREELFFHNLQSGFSLGDATRGSAAIPRIYPPRVCKMNGRQMSLVDGGLSNRLPIDYLFTPPFRPVQILAVDVSNHPRHRRTNVEKACALQREHPDVPIVIVKPETLGRATLIYRSRELRSLIDGGKRAAAAELRSAALPRADRELTELERIL